MLLQIVTFAIGATERGAWARRFRLEHYRMELPMISVRRVLSASAIAALVGAGALMVTAAPATARVVCNNEGDCWHTDSVPRHVPGVTFNVHPDDWYFHQHWDSDRDRHFRDYHEGRGYYRGGVWVQL
jgi:hypothetical protein